MRSEVADFFVGKANVTSRLEDCMPGCLGQRIASGQGAESATLA
jgi:hypothetical protein